jgi:hypothetical protein
MRSDVLDHHVRGDLSLDLTGTVNQPKETGMEVPVLLASVGGSAWVHRAAALLR